MSDDIRYELEDRLSDAGDPLRAIDNASRTVRTNLDEGDWNKKRRGEIDQYHRSLITMRSTIIAGRHVKEYYQGSDPTTAARYPGSRTEFYFDDRGWLGARTRHHRMDSRSRSFDFDDLHASKTTP